MNDLAKLYSPANIPERMKFKPGFSIYGDPNWNYKRDHMTLDDVKKYDDENHRLILKECKQYRFNMFFECCGSKLLAHLWALDKLGSKTAGIAKANIKMMLDNKNYFDNKIKQECLDKGIRCEERPPIHMNSEQDNWKSGEYIYYHGDIVYFTSNPMSVRAKEGLIYLVNRQQFMLVTNANVD